MTHDFIAHPDVELVLCAVLCKCCWSALVSGIAMTFHAANSVRSGDLYGSRSIMNRAKTMFRGLQGVENVYTQHTPLLTATLTNLSTDKLDQQSYPYMAASPVSRV